MLSICIKCTKNIPHEPDICPKNYEGSAKGMEATGAARIVSRLFRNEEVKCFVAMLVTDDDSSCLNTTSKSVDKNSLEVWKNLLLLTVGFSLSSSVENNRI